MSNASLYIKNITVYTENEIIPNGAIYVENGKIIAAGEQESVSPKVPAHTPRLDGKNLNAIPGFIDGHIHGANGADVMDATEEALDRVAEVLPQEGTTSFLATTITQSHENIEKALQTVADYSNKPGQADILGIHLEGPFVEKSKAGAQPAAYITKPDLALFNKWQELSGNKIRTITMAPEHDADGEFIRQLKASGVNVSAGHTDADFAGMKQAVAHGVGQLTHLCNAMNGIHHRDIGAVGAAFQLNELRAELIADGIHVSREMLELIYQNVGKERLILITDAMRAKCLSAGDYELGGQPVMVTEDRAVLEDGTLAGSILKMEDAAKLMLDIAGGSIQDIIAMASMNPAKQLGVFAEKGSITPGKDADILLVEDDLTVKTTICRGMVAHDRR
ncbi:N-acetylglucosamine-6-phosphate deacetylase [Lentibacillus sediminis]|uniref:N-acetylglucosamine-6-phosphate deacetylase n=1 Tax=Lentibacillus sediminis TaxID=1940529 RepID=UPI000C1C38EF|nr:N-acetylglucosamine-6-phosphate deacetylase [Lentibacillus sediminis]